MRINAIVNETAGRGRGMAHDAALHAGELRLDLESHEVTRGTQVVLLTPTASRSWVMPPSPSANAHSAARSRA
jgi:DNA-binding response OmpR family regulator